MTSDTFTLCSRCVNIFTELVALVRFMILPNKGFFKNIPIDPKAPAQSGLKVNPWPLTLLHKKQSHIKLGFGYTKGGLGGGGSSEKEREATAIFPRIISHRLVAKCQWAINV